MGPEEEERLAQLPDPEVVLLKRPISLLIEARTATSKMPEVNGKRIFELRLTAKQWTVGQAGLVKVMRYGFPIVPDFGGTAHAYCGGTLDAEIGDRLGWDHKPRRDDALRGYIIKSRVSDASTLLLAQPHNPHLFRQGVFPIPELLLQVLQTKMQ